MYSHDNPDPHFIRFSKFDPSVHEAALQDFKGGSRVEGVDVLEWNKYSPENQDLWKYQLAQLMESSECKISRICFLADKGSLFSITLVYEADLSISIHVRWLITLVLQWDLLGAVHWWRQYLSYLEKSTLRTYLPHSNL